MLPIIAHVILEIVMTPNEVIVPTHVPIVIVAGLVAVLGIAIEAFGVVSTE